MAKSKTTTKAKTVKHPSPSTGPSAGGARIKGKQLEVPGTERVQDPKIRAALDRFTDAKEGVAEARKEHDVAAEQLVALMHAKKLTTYVDGMRHLRVDVVSGAARVKVKSTEAKAKKGKGKKSALPPAFGRIDKFLNGEAAS